jgi:hypothetical protein
VLSADVDALQDTVLGVYRYCTEHLALELGDGTEDDDQDEIDREAVAEARLAPAVPAEPLFDSDSFMAAVGDLDGAVPHRKMSQRAEGKEE